jgi:hypothetical protein
MIRYSGTADYSLINIVVLGDGEAKQLVIDLCKPPFNLNFTDQFPVEIRIRDEDPIVPTPNISLTTGIMTLDYSEPIPAPAEGMMSPRSKLSIYLFYGSGNVASQPIAPAHLCT